jgi:diaminopimelate epimerase
MTFPFLKMHGAANDFVVIDHRFPFLPADLEPLVGRLCDRRRGVGADGVLLMERDEECDFAMRYFNADGREVEYCGNGARCMARLGFDLGLGSGGRLRFRTGAGVQTALEDGDGGIAIRFGRVRGPDEPMKLDAAGRAFTGRLIRAGVPHFVVEVERVEWVPVGEWGAALRQHARFAPAGTNVDFVARLDAGRIAMRTYERGVEAETLACGSGAIASSLWAVVEGSPSPVTVVTAGGDELRVTLDASGAGAWEATLAGPVAVAFAGEWTDPEVAEAVRTETQGSAARDR